MLSEFLTHFFFSASVIILSTITKGWVNVSTWPYWLGGVLGLILPDIDHFIYIYFLRPYEYVSQRASFLLNKRGILQAFDFLARTRQERTKLIFHSAPAHWVFLILGFWVITSSASLFAKGICVSIISHLTLDLLVDYSNTKNLDMWFKDLNLNLPSKTAKYYVIASFVALLLLTFVF